MLSIFKKSPEETKQSLEQKSNDLARELKAAAADFGEAALLDAEGAPGAQNKLQAATKRLDELNARIDQNKAALEGIDARIQRYEAEETRVRDAANWKLCAEYNAQRKKIATEVDRELLRVVRKLENIIQIGIKMTKTVPQTDGGGVSPLTLEQIFDERVKRHLLSMRGETVTASAFGARTIADETAEFGDWCMKLAPVELRGPVGKEVDNEG